MEIKYYPTVERIIELNALSLLSIRVKKADKAQVLSKSKILEVLQGCQGLNGDVYDKSVVLLVGLVKSHPFASGNRRTAFMTVKDFLTNNHARMGVNDSPNDSRVFQGVREGFYTTDELKEWLQHGKIKPFQR